MHFNFLLCGVVDVDVGFVDVDGGVVVVVRCTAHDFVVKAVARLIVDGGFVDGVVVVDDDDVVAISLDVVDVVVVSAVSVVDFNCHFNFLLGFVAVDGGFVIVDVGVVGFVIVDVVHFILLLGFVDVDGGVVDIVVVDVIFHCNFLLNLINKYYLFKRPQECPT